MSDFYIDRDTLTDLHLLDKDGDGVFDFFNQTITKGGEEALFDIFRDPITDLEEIKRRQATIRFFMDCGHIEFNRESVDFVEHYLKKLNQPQTFSAFTMLRNTFQQFFRSDEMSYVKTQGAKDLFSNLHILSTIFSKCQTETDIPLIRDAKKHLEKIMENPLFAQGIERPLQKLARYTTEKVYYLIRKRYYEEIRSLLNFLYQSDAYRAIAITAQESGFTFPQYSDAESIQMDLRGLFHPLLKDPVANDVALDSSQHILFVTGANMSGKSTLMKAVGIAVYLAHLGFPVPAKSMETSILEGMVTAINLPDNLRSGYSHFYSEVKRIKLVGEKLSESGHILAIFDELFKSTNVKDAYDGSLRIIQALLPIKTSFFIVSTHILEIADKLADAESIAFKHLKTNIRDHNFSFDYQLQDGVSRDRIGLWILEREGVFDLFKQKNYCG